MSRSSRPNTRSAAIALAALVLGGSVLSPFLHGADATTPVPPPAPAVSLDHADSEVALRFDSPPSLGGSSALHVEVTSPLGGDVPVEITLPPFLAPQRLPAGVTSSSTPGELPGTQDTVLSWSPRLQAGGRTSITLDVTAHAEGSDLVVASAGEGPHRHEESVPLTVAPEGTFEEVEVGGSIGTHREPPAERSDIAPLPASARVSAQAASTTSAPAVLTSASGRFVFTAENGTTQPGRSWRVEVWDRDVAPDNPPDLLARGRTDAGGNFFLSWKNNQEANNAGGQDPFIRLIAEEARYWVRLNDGNPNTADGPLVIETPVLQWNVATGSVTNFGTIRPDAAMNRGARVFDALRRGYAWVPKSSTGCWDRNDTVCRRAVADWGPASPTTGAFYQLATDTMFLTPGTSDDTTLHELGHAVMDDLYDDQFPKTTNCAVHTVRGTSSTTCAWTEGFAEWFPAMVKQSSTVFGVNLETATWGSSGWSNGDQVEGRVAGALLDLSDRTNDGYDIYSSNPSASPWQPGIVYEVVSNRHPRTMKEFWNSFPDKNNILAKGALLQNTIDYDAPKPDLMVGAVMVPAGKLVRGSSVTVTDRTLRTNDPAALWATQSTTAYYLSTNGKADASAHRLGQRTVPVLFSAGQSHTGSVTVTIPSSVKSGSTYYVLACADDRKVVPEKSETNNCSMSATLIVS